MSSTPTSFPAPPLPNQPAHKLGLIGDVHAEHERLQTAIEVLLAAGADTLLCTGDLCDGPGNLHRCISLLKQHNVVCVRGNHDRWMLDDRVRHINDAHLRDTLCPTDVSYLSTLPTQEVIPTALGNLLLCHGILDNDLGKVWPGSERMPPERSKGLDKLITAGNYRLLVNGHMHYRIVLDFPGLTHINAGTLSPRHRPGVTLLDCDNNQLSVFEFGDSTRCLKPTKQVPLFDDARHQWADTQAFDSPQDSARQPLALYG